MINLSPGREARVKGNRNTMVVAVTPKINLKIKAPEQLLQQWNLPLNGILHSLNSLNIILASREGRLEGTINVLIASHLSSIASQWGGISQVPRFRTPPASSCHLTADRKFQNPSVV